jgi:MFS family permease
MKSFQGAVAALSFSILLAGSNATTPLLPVYRSLMGFSPLTMSWTFVCYVGALIVFLVLLSRPSVLRWSPALLLAGLLAAIASDLCMAIGTEATILLGRVLTGVGVGLGTGPAAALVVDAFGARGRSVSATGNLVGAVIGTVLSQLAVSLLDGRVAIGWVFHVHAMASFVLLVVLLAIFRSMRHENRKALGAIDVMAPRVYRTLLANWLPLCVGSLAWILISVALTFLSSFFRESGMLIVGSSGMIVMLVCCAACQLGARQVARLAPMATGVEAMLIGLLLVVAAVFTGLSGLSLLGLAFVGAGIGISYRMALVMLTRGAPPNIHGVLSSTYAAITYAIAAISVIVLGMLGNVFGLHNVVLAALALMALFSAILVRGSPRVSMERR